MSAETADRMCEGRSRRNEKRARRRGPDHSRQHLGRSCAGRHARERMPGDNGPARQQDILNGQAIATTTRPTQPAGTSSAANRTPDLTEAASGPCAFSFSLRRAAGQHRRGILTRGPVSEEATAGGQVRGPSPPEKRPSGGVCSLINPSAPCSYVLDLEGSVVFGW
ncbi:hypothetical protein AAFF_G00304910 [Aldrovandia affinis]|uniref:Uncharacterized protein n=1 Tax=Aldrovandia affinis TaxID=143900 RepID=A0AAD7WRE8_9TELE|nr:hypothetical protein AAFF_G00304910 [Aldrovandia affinis]